MTAQEREEYNRLPKSVQEDYDYNKRKHPNWSHQQLISKIGFESQLDTMVDSGKDVDPKDPSVLKQILEGTKRFLKRYGIDVGKIMDMIDGAIKSLSRIIDYGLDFLGDLVDGAIGWLFD